MRAFRLARNALERLGTHGVRYTARYAGKRLSESYHEWRLGVQTAGKIEREELGFEGSFNNCYYPSDYQSIYQALRQLQVRPNEDVLLDYGSGMGRVVVVAATFPFRKVIGLELSEQMNAIARKNVSRARHKLRCQDVELVTGDAATYQVPADVNCVFFYNSFKGPVLAAALANVRESLRRAPRRLLFVYKNTESIHSVFAQHPWLVQTHEFQSSEFNYYRHFSHRVLILESRL
jgi:precorrin-6B methylase 2